MKNPLEIFEEIACIPHISFHTQELFEWIVRFANSCGYGVQTDKTGNIYAFGKNPRFCLQSHYDMVGVGEANKQKPLELYIEDNFLKAKNSSLGADNGIGVAMQLYLMQKYKDLEFLFTNNEEVGLLGAKSLEMKIISHRLINIDSESFGEIILGCAGGYDMNVVFDLKSDKSFYKNTYQITARGFQGGHSGVDIHKDIKNAIVEICYFIDKVDGGICSIVAGEKINSIPVNSQAIIKTNQIINSSEDFLVQEIKSTSVCYDKKAIIDFILGIQNGVRLKDGDDVIDSVNISLLSQEKSKIKISLMGRSNTKSLLDNSLLEAQKLAKRIDPNAQITIDDFYFPWQRNISDDDEFLRSVKNAFGDHFVKVCQIHAGLECGILQERFEAMGKKDVKMLSIGPTILSPHSVNERLDINSFKSFSKVLENLVENYKI
ncbi:M20/M25/M40 family metallo-hydrolase [Helicobacter cappadocius]|uniref:M20/M25/M40 family metallo-hydrolase n=1 Tax=Helicobacter cappadocius TaxID=3063998 RepID=A0AA90PKL3_9HELI|nr:MULTISPECIES: M20/M25/M40 family metallo-hydrolase [unclassified Helicobacter]MDO7253320.1 M20/M25/M40 family metallo-hydrolase [Helicobacter sp. faydin-H75]MDP2539250.1 M20/M25/M40 family metallo-hydrolase [Helicobacter sp. faydin-H76]